MTLQAQWTSKNTSSGIRADVRRQRSRSVAFSTAGSASTKAIIHHLSDTAALFETKADLSEGELIEVRFPNGDVRAAAVVWSGDQLFGCNFAERLPPANVSLTLLRATYANVRANSRIGIDPQHQAADAKLSLRARVLVIISLAMVSWAIVGIVVAWIKLVMI
jgi:hypothetical protein